MTSLPECYAAGMNTNMKLVVTLQECGHDLCCCSMVLFWYACMEEWKTQTTAFTSYRNLRIYLKLSTTPEVIWQHLLGYKVNISRLENYVFWMRQVVHRSMHPPMETRHRSGGAKLPSAVSSHFKRFHIYKKHKFIFGSHLISADESVLLNHIRPHTLWRYFGMT